MLWYLWEGARAGLVLSLLVGPLVVLLVQLSLRRGTLASFVAATGIWCSDLTFIFLAHYGLNGLEDVLHFRYLNELIGSIGALLLVGIGLVMWFRKPPSMKGKKWLPSRRGLLSAWLQGFALNAFNPFTIFFWSTFVVTQVHKRDLMGWDAALIYTGVVGVLVLTDSAKVLGARKLRELMKPSMMVRAQRVGAVALGVFGVALGVRVWL
jgi:threonine/homoserine/homoserine lactone efflux protein